ncbi:hypothetical protein [Corynebacterium sp. 335C]
MVEFLRSWTGLMIVLVLWCAVRLLIGWDESFNVRHLANLALIGTVAMAVLAALRRFRGY